MAVETTQTPQFHPERGPHTPRPDWRLPTLGPFAGVVFALFAFILTHDRIGLDPLALLAVVAIVGFVVGLVCGLPVYAILRNRDIREILPRIIWIVAATIVVLTFLPIESGSLAILMFLGGPASLIICAVFFAAFSPRRYYGRGICFHCGYDLRASTDVGRCPECGWVFDSELAQTSERSATKTSPLARTVRWVFLHPLLMLLAFVTFGFLLLAVDKFQQHRLRGDILNAIQVCRQANEPFPLHTITPFDWEQAYIIGGYASIASVEKQLGFRWAEVSRTGISSRDDIQVLAFVKDREVVGSTTLPVWGEQGIEFLSVSPYPHDASFEVLPAASNEMARLLIMPAETKSTNSVTE